MVQPYIMCIRVNLKKTGGGMESIPFCVFSFAIIYAPNFLFFFYQAVCWRIYLRVLHIIWDQFLQKIGILLLLCAMIPTSMSAPKVLKKVTLCTNAMAQCDSLHILYKYLLLIMAVISLF